MITRPPHIKGPEPPRGATHKPIFRTENLRPGQRLMIEERGLPPRIVEVQRPDADPRNRNLGTFARAFRYIEEPHDRVVVFDAELCSGVIKLSIV